MDWCISSLLEKFSIMFYKTFICPLSPPKCILCLVPSVPYDPHALSSLIFPAVSIQLANTATEFSILVTDIFHFQKFCLVVLQIHYAF